MSETIEITGNRPLVGDLFASGAKNAALPLLIAALLTGEECIFDNVPNLEDVNLTLHLLEHCGAETSFTIGAETDAPTSSKNLVSRSATRPAWMGGSVRVRVPALKATEASYSLVKALRASFWVLAPLLARGHAARVALPGGDIIGARPVDIHLEALTKMGADIRVKHGVVLASAVGGLRPASIDLRSPSVGATHQILMAAALTPGTSVINGAAREPEIVALAEMLTKMGAEIEGAGSATIVVRGRDALGGAHVHMIGDRIEAGTYLLAGVATRGDVRVSGVNPKHLPVFLELLASGGVSVETGADWVRVSAPEGMRGFRACTAPFPELATDLQAPLMAALAVARGEGVIEENVFDGRYNHVAELCRMGASIRVQDRIAIITGVDKLCGAPVEAFDIRAGAALVIAGLAAEGTTVIHEPHHLRRGYEALERKLTSLGAIVGSKFQDLDDYAFSGC